MAKFALLVDLDSLLDTRAGTLGVSHPKRLAEMMQDTSYTTRVIDQFEGVDNQTFSKLYSLRNNKILRNSFKTDIYKWIQDFVDRVQDRVIGTPVVADVEITINTHPFDIDEKTQALIHMAMLKSIKNCPPIKFVSHDVSKLHPVYLQLFEVVIMYNFNDWISHFFVEGSELVKHQFPNTTMMVPALLSRLDNGEVPKDLGNEFLGVMQLMAPIVSLTFLPIEYFCIFVAKRKKPTTTDTPKDAGDEEDEEVTLEGFPPKKGASANSGPP